MTQHHKTAVVRGAAKARAAFCAEVARELGLEEAAVAHKRVPRPAIEGALSKQMVALAEQQLGTDGP